MRFSQLGAVALAGVSQAFLIPPTVSSADSEIINTLPFETDAPIDGRLIGIECPGCPVRFTTLEGQTHAATGQVDSILRFNFYLEHGDKDRLMLNGLQMYPVDVTSAGWLTADQLVKTSDGKLNYAATPVLGYEFSAENLKSSDNEQMNLVAIRIQVIEIGGTFIRGFPYIDLRLLETPSGKLMIGNVEVTEATVQPKKLTDGNQECTTLLCKWRSIVAEKMSKLKGCGGRKRPQHGAVTEIMEGPKAQGPKLTKPFHHPHPHPEHRPHHHGRGGFARFVRSIVFHVLIPIMIGVVVGITASLVGMIVGHIAIFIWRVLFRRGQRAQYHRVQAEESTSKDDEDSKNLLGHDNPPPVYEDAPAYEEAVDEKA